MDSPVTIRENEVAIAEAAFREGYIKPRNIERNGRKVAVIGAGPAGLAAANQLNGKGYTVTVFDKNEAPGGLLRYGIPNFKLHKPIIDRRIRVMEEEGIHFKMNSDVDVRQLPEGFDAYCICTGAPTARDLPIPGRELKGIHPALDMLAQQNRILAGMTFPKEQLVTAKGKKVLVIGGGDTGSDCIGTSNRQGAVSVTQIEIMPQPPVGQNPATPWPQFPIVLKTTSSHEEGCSRLWSLATRKFLGKNGKVCGVEVEQVEWTPDPDGAACHEAHRKGGSDRSRPGSSGNGIPKARTSPIRRKRIRSRRCGKRSQPGGTRHCQRTESGNGHRQLSQ